jgi:hypothetical protein
LTKAKFQSNECFLVEPNYLQEKFWFVDMLSCPDLESLLNSSSSHGVLEESAAEKFRCQRRQGLTVCCHSKKICFHWCRFAQDFRHMIHFQRRQHK